MTSGTNQEASVALRRFSKLTCFSILFLIFVGGMVTSTSSGLAVPDWPLSYGTLFPPMIGGVFYEHGHRMVASFVGFLTLCLAIWLGFKEKRRWVRTLGFCALAAVILQGILGGITVLFFLPTPVSVAHGVLAQTFFILTIIIAYSQSLERNSRFRETQIETPKVLLQWSVILFSFVYVQLILGAVMRHTGSGLAVPDFPTIGGSWFPILNESMLARINDWRFQNDLDAVTMTQVIFHLIHRTGAAVIFFTICVVTYLGVRYALNHRRVLATVWLIDYFVAVQITLGILTVLTQKHAVITSLHVATGAAILGLSTLLLLRISPLQWHSFKHILN